MAEGAKDRLEGASRAIIIDRVDRFHCLPVYLFSSIVNCQRSEPDLEQASMAVGASSSSLSSFSSLSSTSGDCSDDSTPKSKTCYSGSTVKLLCSYGGKILPRYPDGKLRYKGGETRVLAVDRTIPFSELLVKLGELCGWGVPVSLRCQLPTEDLDALVSVTSDEDLVNLIEEYDLGSRDRPSSPLKIRAFLFLFNSCHHHQQRAPTSPVKVPVGSPPSSIKGETPFFSTIRRVHHQIPTGRFPDVRCSHRHHHQPACLGHARPSFSSSSYRHRHHQPYAYLVPHGNHWQ